MTDAFFVTPPVSISFRKILNCIHKIKQMEDVQADPSLHFTPSMIKNLKKVIEIEYTKLEKMIEDYQK